MFGMNKIKTVVDKHPRELFLDELDKVIIAAKSRHLPLRTIGDILTERGQAIRHQDAILRPF
jgi:hypothetical protein